MMTENKTHQQTIKHCSDEHCDWHIVRVGTNATNKANHKGCSSSRRTQVSSANVIRTTTSCFTLEWCTSCVSLSSKRSQTAKMCWEKLTNLSRFSSSLCSVLPKSQCKTLLGHWHIHKCSTTHIHTQKSAARPIKQTKPSISAATQNQAVRLAKRRFYSVPPGHDGFFRKKAFPKHRGF